jgi:AcrR family transcriptional regulator
MGTIYAIFPGKEDLFRGILDRRGQQMLQVARDGAHSDPDPRIALDRLIEAYIDYFIAHPSFLRMHLRLGTSWVLGPAIGSPGQVQLWAEIHTAASRADAQRHRRRRFRREDPAFLAKIFSALDQVLLADWVAGGMKADRSELIARMRGLVDRVILR